MVEEISLDRIITANKQRQKWLTYITYSVDASISQGKKRRTFWWKYTQSPLKKSLNFHLYLTKPIDIIKSFH